MTIVDKFKKAEILILNRNARCELFINRSVQFYSHRYRQFITLRWLPCIKWLQVYCLSASIMWMSNYLSSSLISYIIVTKACMFLKSLTSPPLSLKRLGVTYNGNSPKNPDIKTPLVVSFTLEVVIHFSPLPAFWCQGSVNFWLKNKNHRNLNKFLNKNYRLCMSLEKYNIF